MNTKRVNDLDETVSRDLEMENIAGNILIAQYQLERLRERLTQHVGESGMSKSILAYKHDDKLYKLGIDYKELTEGDEHEAGRIALIIENNKILNLENKQLKVELDAFSGVPENQRDLLPTIQELHGEITELKKWKEDHDCDEHADHDECGSDHDGCDGNCGRYEEGFDDGKEEAEKGIESKEDSAYDRGDNDGYDRGYESALEQLNPKIKDLEEEVEELEYRLADNDGKIPKVVLEQIRVDVNAGLQCTIEMCMRLSKMEKLR